MMSLKILFNQPPFVFLLMVILPLNLLLYVLSSLRQWNSCCCCDWMKWKQKPTIGDIYFSRSRLFWLLREKKNQRWAKHELEIMVEVVHDLDPILDRVHDRDLSHQHLRKTFSFFHSFFHWYFLFFISGRAAYARDWDRESGYRLHVSPLNPRTSRRDIEKIFAKFGPINEVSWWKEQHWKWTY